MDFFYLLIEVSLNSDTVIEPYEVKSYALLSKLPKTRSILSRNTFETPVRCRNS